MQAVQFKQFSIVQQVFGGKAMACKALSFETSNHKPLIHAACMSTAITASQHQATVRQLLQCKLTRKARWLRDKSKQWGGSTAAKLYSGDDCRQAAMYNIDHQRQQFLHVSHHVNDRKPCARGRHAVLVPGGSVGSMNWSSPWTKPRRTLFCTEQTYSSPFCRSSATMLAKCRRPVHAQTHGLYEVYIDESLAGWPIVTLCWITWPARRRYCR